MDSASFACRGDVRQRQVSNPRTIRERELLEGGSFMSPLFQLQVCIVSQVAYRPISFNFALPVLLVARDREFEVQIRTKKVQVLAQRSNMVLVFDWPDAC